LFIKLHALSSGLKAYTSTVAERFSQICRVACGGHGYLVASGIKPINNMLDAACSYEGDNAVLFQQTARYEIIIIIKKFFSRNLNYIYIYRYLLKAIQQIDENNEVNIESSIAYLYSRTSPPATIVNLDDYCRLFECRSQMLVMIK